MTSYEQPGVIKMNWRILSHMYLLSIPLCSLLTFWTSRSTSQAAELVLPFTTKTPTPTTIYTTPLLILSTVKMVFPTPSYHHVCLAFPIFMFMVLPLYHHVFRAFSIHKNNGIIVTTSMLLRYFPFIPTMV